MDEIKLLPLATMEKIMKKASPDMRVSEDAKEALREYLEEEAHILSKKATELANHAGRRTIKSEDIRLAAKKH
jgi:histone H3/H4